MTNKKPDCLAPMDSTIGLMTERELNYFNKTSF